MFYWVVNILLQKICRPQNFKKLDEKNNVTNRGSSPHGQRTEIGRTEDTRKTCLVSSKHLVYVQFPFSVQWVTTPSNIYYLDLCEDRYGFLPLIFPQKQSITDVLQGSNQGSALTVGASENGFTKRYLKLNHHNGNNSEHRIKK